METGYQELGVARSPLDGGFTASRGDNIHRKSIGSLMGRPRGENKAVKPGGLSRGDGASSACAIELKDSKNVDEVAFTHVLSRYKGISKSSICSSLGSHKA